MSPLLEAKALEYAKGRLNALVQDIDRYLKSDLYEYKAQEIPGMGGRTMHVIVLKQSPPDDWTFVTFNIANDLRSTLDRTCAAIARAAGEDGKSAKFPFGMNELEIRNRTRKKKGSADQIPEDVFNVIMGLKPYPGGNDLLVGLNDLANTQKHDSLVHHPMVTTVGGISMHIQHRGGGGPTIIPGPSWPPKWDSVRNQLLIGYFGAGTKVQNIVQLKPEIEIGDVRGIRGKPAVRTLREIANEVERGLTVIEAEARRIGLSI